MMRSPRSRPRRALLALFADEGGQTTVEYILILAMAITVAGIFIRQFMKIAGERMLEDIERMILDRFEKGLFRANLGRAD